MTTYAGGTQVRSGYYLDASSFRFTNVDRDGQALPGGADARWRKVPVLAVVAAAPVLGGLFVVALPFLGFGVTAYAVARKLGVGARKGAEELAATMAPPFVPGEAHLTGEPAGEGHDAAAAGAAPADERVEALEREIAEKRGRP